MQNVKNGPSDENIPRNLSVEDLLPLTRGRYEKKSLVQRYILLVLHTSENIAAEPESIIVKTEMYDTCPL